MSFDAPWADLGWVMLASLASVVVLMVVTALIARRQGRVVVVDAAWGLGFVVIAVTAAATAAALGVGDGWRQLLLVVLVGAWGLRLGVSILRKLVGHRDEDPRYAKLMDGKPFSYAITRVFATQGAVMWFVSLPVQVAVVTDWGWWWVVVLGVVVWAIGLFFETVGDAQLAAYKATPREERAPVLDQGLWAWTRHPNYFGDAAVWWGLFLVAASAWPGVLAVLSPLAMTHFLRNVTGARLLEQTMSSRPGWDEYAARVPMFFPRPPSR